MVIKKKQHKYLSIKEVLKTQFFYKKGRKITLLPFLFLMAFSSCSLDPEKYGRITFHNTADSESFIFSVSEKFIDSTSDSKPDKKITEMSQAEAKLLIALLKKKKYCLNSFGNPKFNITSRQEKIYDMTFAHLIEENYNLRPIVPRMYFGKCVEK